MHHSAHRLGDDVVGGALAVRSEKAIEAPESGNAGVDQARVELGKLLVADAHVVEKSWPKVLDDNVRVLRQIPEDLPPFLALEIERQAALVAVEPEKVPALGLTLIVLPAAAR
jgi:hypothetical protein